MSKEELRTVVWTAAVLLVASFVRLAWEVRAVPPILPPQPVPEELVQETRLAIAREERMSMPLAPGELVDPNRDPDYELARLPGLGPALSSRIVADRELNGPYEGPSDLQRVAGIGPATMQRLEPLLDFSNPLPEVRRSGGRSQGTRAEVMSPERDGTTVAARSTAGLPSAARLDLNRATSAQLESLPGLGPTLARRILERRGRVGRFGSIEELATVDGIGPTTIERLRPLVTTRSP